jgi:uncharacterized coiled-coil protein SlyX
MANSNSEHRLDRIEAVVANNAEAIADLAQEMRELTSNIDRVLARSAILDDVLLELRDSHEQHQRNFEEHQRTTNAALQSLEAILLQLIRNFPQNHS